MCFDELPAGGSAACDGQTPHHACFECLAHLGTEAAARPMAHLTDHELRNGRYAVRCPCSGLGCGGFFSTATLDAALRVAAADHEVDQATALYLSLVALAQAQQPLSALEPIWPSEPELQPSQRATGERSTTWIRQRSARAIQRIRCGVESKRRTRIEAREEAREKDTKAKAKARAEAAKAAKAKAKAEAEAAKAKAQAQAEAAKARAEAEAAAQLEFIRAQFRRRDGSFAAFMCRNCSFGPVDHMACHDLAAHHGEARGRAQVCNACPACGWFSAQLADWPAWDGQKVGSLDVQQLAMEAAVGGESQGANLRFRIAALGASFTSLTSGLWPERRRSADSPRVRLRTGEWQCPHCTLVNGCNALVCDACEQGRN